MTREKSPARGLKYRSKAKFPIEINSSRMLRKIGKWPREARAGKKGKIIDAIAPDMNIAFRLKGVTDRSDSRSMFNLKSTNPEAIETNGPNRSLETRGPVNRVVSKSNPQESPYNIVRQAVGEKE